MKSKIYASIANGHVNNAQLNEMAETFARANQKHGITGYLFFFNGRYLQFIESDDSAVETLMHQIRKDIRHTVFNEKSFTYDSRLLPGWCMKAIDKSEENLDYAEEAINQHLLMNNLLQQPDPVKTNDELLQSIRRLAAVKSRMMLGGTE